MEKDEMRKITKQWLFSKGFQKCTEKAYSGTGYFYPLTDFDIIILFNKDRFDELYYIDVGFRLKDDPLDCGYVRTNIRRNIYSYYYEQWEKQDYVACLEEIYKLYIQPYHDLGIKKLKKIVRWPHFRREHYLFLYNSVKRIRKMKIKRPNSALTKFLSWVKKAFRAKQK